MRTTAAGRLVVCGPDGGALVARAARRGLDLIDLAALSPGAKPAAVKLLVNGSLADVVPLAP